MRNMERKIVIRLNDKMLDEVKSVLVDERGEFYRKRTLSDYVRTLIRADLVDRSQKRARALAEETLNKNKVPFMSATRRRKSGTR